HSPVRGETTSAAARFRALACGKYRWQSRAMEFDLDAFVAATLAEDLGEGGDITSAAVIPADARFEGVMRTREPIVAVGLPIAEAFFAALDPDAHVARAVEDGAAAEAGDILLRVSGRARALLTAERSALNTVQHLSGIATLTRRYVDAI